jgi:hypothetical protein
MLLVDSVSLADVKPPGVRRQHRCGKAEKLRSIKETAGAEAPAGA